MHAAPLVVICAPPELRKGLSAELTAQGRAVLDLSELDQALFGPEGAGALVAAGKPVALAASLPAELKEDFTKGLTGCRAREKQDAEARRACADQLVAAVWERHLARLRPERVIELKTMTMLGDGSVFVATYRPGEPVLSGLHWPDASAKSVTDMVRATLHEELPGIGVRQNSSVLPVKQPLPAAELSQGAPQRLEALSMPEERCLVPSKLSVSPASVPLAVTIASLWETTVRNNVKPKAAAPKCSLELKPRALVFHCGSELSEVELFEGTPLGDAAVQATLARRFVQLKLHASCR